MRSFTTKSLLHVSARQNLRPLVSQFHQDIGTWYYHETLRNDSPLLHVGVSKNRGTPKMDGL